MKRKKKPALNDQAGRLVFEGREATKFWIRTFNLEKELDFAKERMKAYPKGFAAVPIIAEYELDPQLKFVFIIIAQVDQLGIIGGTGAIYFAAPGRLKEVLKQRDFAAKTVMDKMSLDEVLTMESKRESGRPE